MSQVSLITLTSDSAASLSGQDLSKFPNIAIKPAEITWNDMQTEDLNDSVARRLFSSNAEIIQSTSGFTVTPKWNWTDFLVEHSVEKDAIFVFLPHPAIYPNEQDNVVSSTMKLKTNFIDFFNMHHRKTGKIKHFVLNSGNIFCGVGLVMWQCQEILSRMDPEKSLSLLQLKEVFDRYARRTKTISIMDNASINTDFQKQLSEPGLKNMLSAKLKRKHWLSVTFTKDNVQMGDQLSLEAQITKHFSELANFIETEKLAFPRIVISCSTEQWTLISKLNIFGLLNRFIEGTNIKIMHQQSSLTAQVLTGKNAIHISYSHK